MKMNLRVPIPVAYPKVGLWSIGRRLQKLLSTGIFVMMQLRMWVSHLHPYPISS